MKSVFDGDHSALHILEDVLDDLIPFDLVMDNFEIFPHVLATFLDLIFCHHVFESLLMACKVVAIEPRRKRIRLRGWKQI